MVPSKSMLFLYIFITTLCFFLIKKIHCQHGKHMTRHSVLPPPFPSTTTTRTLCSWLDHFHFTEFYLCASLLRHPL